MNNHSCSHHKITANALVRGLSYFVWECIVDDDKRQEWHVSQQFYSLIKGKRITPYFFEGLATLENVPRLVKKGFHIKLSRFEYHR